MSRSFVLRFIRSKKFRILVLLWMVKVALGFAVYVLALRSPLVVQVLDLVGVSSTFYMPDVKCNFCNSFEYNYLIEPQVNFSNQEVFLLILVISHSENFDRRQVIRETWGAVKVHRSRQIRTYFVIGLPESNNAPSERSSSRPVHMTDDDKSARFSVSEILRQEISTHRDILQVNIIDDYRYLTNKTIAGLRWATSQLHSSFILKTDDDSFNVIHRFVNYLSNVKPINFLAGMCSSGEQPHRMPGHRWYVPVEAYPGRVYPVHAKGRAYVLSQDAAKQVIRVSPHIRFNAMEDLFITGLCRAIAGLSCVHVRELPNRNEEISDCDVASFVFNVHNVKLPEAMRRLWHIVYNKTFSNAECLGRI